MSPVPPLAVRRSLRVIASCAVWWPALLVAQQPVRLSAVTLSSAQVIEGRQVAGAVVLERAARAGGVTVQLSASDTVLRISPTSLVIPENATTATFLITAGHVVASRSGTIVATASGATVNSPSVTVKPLSVIGVTLTAPVIAGRPVSGTLTLDAPAPVPLSAQVALSSAVASVRTSAPIPANATSVPFILTAPCTATASTMTVQGSIAGSTGGSASRTVQIPAASVVRLGKVGGAGVDPTPLRLTGGQTITMGAVASCPRSGAPWNVALSTTGQALGVSPVTIAGGDTLVTWSQFIPVVDANTSSTLIATLNGVATNYTMSILGRQLLGFRLPDTLKLGRSTSVTLQGNVVLDNAAQPGGVKVTFRATGLPGVPPGFQIPSSVTVPERSTGVVVPVTLVADPRNFAAVVAVEASLNGSSLIRKVVVVP